MVEQGAVGASGDDALEAREAGPGVRGECVDEPVVGGGAREDDLPRPADVAAAGGAGGNEDLVLEAGEAAVDGDGAGGGVPRASRQRADGEQGDERCCA